MSCKICNVNNVKCHVKCHVNNVKCHVKYVTM